MEILPYTFYSDLVTVILCNMIRYQIDKDYSETKYKKDITLARRH